jgi:peptidoglycan/xylan/chitin deacetylase (PgdA/CDA1 family)
MPPQPPESPASARRPRHAAGAVPRTFGAAVFADGYFTGPYAADGYAADGLGMDAGSTGRHRRPESLADSTLLRPAPGIPDMNGRFTGGRFESRDGFAGSGFRPEGGRAVQRRSEDMRHAAERGRGADLPRGADLARGADLPHGADLARGADLPHGADLPRVEWARSAEWARGATRQRRSGGPRNRRGKHAKPSPQLTLTMLPLPAMRDALPAMRDALPAVRDALPAVRDALPAVRDALSEGRRAAGAFRDWALYTGDRPPVTGSHRAPGTLPIESWLLIGKQRQQALLATLVAAGLVLIMIPVQHGADLNAVNAAEHGSVSTDSSRKAGNKAPDAASKPPRQATTPGKPAPGQPVPAQPTAVPPAAAAPTESGSAEDPAIAVPPGTGPGQSLRRTGSDAIALTFDDGPDPVQTPRILALLAKYHVKATFCLIGENAQKHPEIVQQIVAAGHTLCNHTWNHSLTIGEDEPAAIRADLQKTDAAIRAAVPDAKIPFFRAPGGNFTDRLVSVAYGEGMASLYWEVDPRDWDHSADTDAAAHTDRLIATVEKDVRPGSIILSHDFKQPDTIAAYEKLLPWLTQNFEIGLPVPPAPVAPPSSSPPASPPSEASGDSK